jgi:hypothetical protein
MAFAGASAETQIVLRSVRSCILREADSSFDSLWGTAIDWKHVQYIAGQNRLSVLVLRGLNKSAKSIPVDQRAALEERQLDTIIMNAADLVTLRDVIPKLESGGVNAIVLKGPVAQKLVHGDFFAKPSYDVDLLVSPRDYDTSSRLLAGKGFVLARECASPWWKLFLGEQHFFRAGPLRIIDLHYRTQQPGSPAPRETQWFISQSVSVSVGGIQVQTLSRTNTCLLSCMSLSKALVHREPAGGHACDIAAFLGNCRSEELEQLFDDAVKQGLRNTVALGLRSANLLFGVKVCFEDRSWRNGSGDTSDADLLRMILSPWSTEIRWPRRSKILWDLCDDKRAYLQAIAWKISADICRLFYESRGRSSSTKPGQ